MLHFPYHLVLRDSTGLIQKQVGDTTPNYGGQLFSLVLRRDSTDRMPISSRWVYVFTIDNHGEGKLLFGESQNRFPFANSMDRRIAPVVIPLPAEPTQICEPYGVDTFLMVASADPLPVPASIFNFEPVLRNDPTRDGKKLPATNWSIERIAIRSVPPPSNVPGLIAAEKACSEDQQPQRPGAKPQARKSGS